MDLDLTLKPKRPFSLIVDNFIDARRHFKKWELSNRMSLMIIKCGILEAFRGAVSKSITNAKQVIVELEKCFTKSNKAEISTLL